MPCGDDERSVLNAMFVVSLRWRNEPITANQPKIPQFLFIYFTCSHNTRVQFSYRWAIAPKMCSTTRSFVEHRTHPTVCADLSIIWSVRENGNCSQFLSNTRGDCSSIVCAFVYRKCNESEQYKHCVLCSIRCGTLKLATVERMTQTECAQREHWMEKVIHKTKGVRLFCLLSGKRWKKVRMCPHAH